MIRIVLADDHTAVRHALAGLLGAESDLLVIGQAADGKQSVDHVRRLAPDVVLMDINMPAMNGIDATRQINGEFPAVRVIGLSVFESTEQAKPMLDAGAVAYVSKTDPPDVLLNAIRTCHEQLSSAPA